MTTLEERQALSRFIYDRSWTPLWGAYLYPLRYFGPERSTNPNDYLEVIRVLEVGETDIGITRGGGLFARDHDCCRRRQEEIDRIVDLFNLVLCELCLHDLVSLPVTDPDIQSGKLVGKHASITGGWGSHGDRSWGPYALLCSDPGDMSGSGNLYWPPNFYWTPFSEAVLDQIDSLSAAVRLGSVSSTLPSLLVSASHYASRHNIGETITNAWMICEQLLSDRWDDYVGTLVDKGRRARLEDRRTYSVAVQAEVLHTAGVMAGDLYRLLQEARKVRNDLVHKAVLGHDAAALSMEALRAMLQWVGIDASRLQGYLSQSGGIGQPIEALDPGFRFR